MSSYFLKQPNGLLARFSAVVDHFTHANLTREEAFEIACHDMGRRDAADKIQRALEDDHLGAPWSIADGLNRWREATETVADVHGAKELQRFLRELEVK